MLFRSSIIGLAWDCGAVTTGPVTVPLVLALGIGVCKIVKSGDSEGSGFGIVTLASLFPILAVFLLGIYHLSVQDYYGQPNYKGNAIIQTVDAPSVPVVKDAPEKTGFSQEEYDQFIQTGDLDATDFDVRYVGGQKRLVDGKIVHRGADIEYVKTGTTIINEESLQHWNSDTSLSVHVTGAILTAIQAILPLSLFLFVVLRFVLRSQVQRFDEILMGISLAVMGMAIFVLGITMGLTPLGDQLGGNIPGAFTHIVPWKLEGFKQAIFEGVLGKLLAALFAFFLGYGATLAEPALNALGATVEKITSGAFKKSLLMHTVAFGVGLGIASGVLKIV